MKTLPKTLQTAIGILALLGGTAIASSFVVGSVFTNAPFLILALFAVMCAPASVSLGTRVRLSVLQVIVLAALLLVGTPEAVLIAAAGALAILVVAHPRTTLHQAVAMLTGYPVEAVLAGWSFALCGGRPGEFGTPSSLVALLFASLVYYLSHTLMAATLVGFEEGTTVLVVWFDRYSWTLPSYLSAGAAAALVGLLRQWAGLHAFVILVPFVLLLFQHYRLRAERDREREHFRQEVARMKGVPGGAPDGAGSAGTAGRAPAGQTLPSGSSSEPEARYVGTDCPPEGVRRRWTTRQAPRPTLPPAP